MEMIMTAGMISAVKAEQYGLVNEVVPQEELLAKGKAIASKIMNNSMVAISAAIKAVNDNYVDGVNGFTSEIEAFGEAFGTDDFKEGTQAFLQKRKASF
jgi:enoyl-CoA hydratase